MISKALKPNLLIAITLLIALSLTLPAILYAYNITSISDIQANPSKYYNTAVILSGQVTESQAQPAGTKRGTYSIVDESEQSIRIKTKNLPAVGEIVTLKGIVMSDTEGVLIKEIKRPPSIVPPIVWGLIGLGIVLIILAVILVIILLKPHKPLKEEIIFEKTCSTCGNPLKEEWVICPKCAAPIGKEKAPTVKLERPVKEEPATLLLSTARLIVDSGPLKGKIFYLDKNKIRFGRGTQGNDISMDGDPAISQEHFLIRSRDNEYYIADRGSANGTIVNDKLITGETLLKNNDKILVGDTTLIFKKRE